MSKKPAHGRYPGCEIAIFTFYFFPCWFPLAFLKSHPLP
jgi:hypothetical protein